MTSKLSSVKGKYYIGLMSGTSADGIDIALVDFNVGKQAKLVSSSYLAYSQGISDKITSLYQPGHNEVDRAFHLDIELAQLFSQAIHALILKENINASDIIAIGNHGQTIRHRPREAYPFTLQIGCCQTLATLTGIRVVGQFRRKDMALGGQGAPLVPIFHQQLFRQKTDDSFVVNIGGIANITYIPEQGSSKGVLGFDTGPGNALLDDWYSVHRQDSATSFDANGTWAAIGQVNQTLLAQLMQDDYIKAVPPKSTGREYFNLDWLDLQLQKFNSSSKQQVSPVDIQATLLAFTAQSIVCNIKALAKQGKVFLCGGGVHNAALVRVIKHELQRAGLAYQLKWMNEQNINSDQLEAMAFAWLAYAYDHNLVSNMPAVTGASANCTLGCEFIP